MTTLSFLFLNRSNALLCLQGAKLATDCNLYSVSSSEFQRGTFVVRL